MTITTDTTFSTDIVAGTWTIDPATPRSASPSAT